MMDVFLIEYLLLETRTLCDHTFEYLTGNLNVSTGLVSSIRKLGT